MWVVGTQMSGFALLWNVYVCDAWWVSLSMEILVRAVSGWPKRKGRCGDMIDWVFHVLEDERKKLIGVLVLYCFVSGTGDQDVGILHPFDSTHLGQYLT
jgi:hypothetical protein